MRNADHTSTPVAPAPLPFPEPVIMLDPDTAPQPVTVPEPLAVAAGEHDADWMDDAPLLTAWARFVEAGDTPFTIPGHKRLAHRLSPVLGRLLDADVPLYGGLDSVKLSADLVGQAERRGAALWRADWCRYSTGGSTHANQVLALAVGRPGDTVLVSRTAHRSTLLGLVMAGLRPVWLPTEIDRRHGVPAGLSLRAVEQALAAHPEAVGLFCVEPSYLGTLSDLPAVIGMAHDRGVPVIVDQAWGAHFGFHPHYPRHALDQGADAMITSAHKTLPAFSQAAIIVARTTRLDEDRLERAFEAAHTTSPAGAILASTDAARGLLASPTGVHLLAEMAQRVAALRGELAQGGLLTLSPGDFPAGRFDPAKLVLLLAPSGHSGIDLEAALLARGLPVEMADRDTVVPLVGMLDDASTLGRLRDALLASIATAPAEPRQITVAAHWDHTAPQAMTPREAFFARHDTVPLERAVGSVSAELIAPYPPGIPIAVPGEVITERTLTALRASVAAGSRIAYAADPSLRTIQIATTRVSGTSRPASPATTDEIRIL